MNLRLPIIPKASRNPGKAVERAARVTEIDFAGEWGHSGR